MGAQSDVSVHKNEINSSENSPVEVKHLEDAAAQDGNLVYDGDEEPEIHMRTWIALAAMFLLNYVQVIALQGPPAVLSYIGKSLNGTQAETWVPNSLSLVQAVVSPLIASASDIFQARKTILVGSSLVSFVGAAIAPGSKDIYRLIASQVLIGFGFASVPLAYCVPSEILPRKWRPMAQAGINIAAALGAISGPLMIGALTRGDIENGWRKFYWIQMAAWGLTAIGIFTGYKPPKRHTRLDHLTFYQKLGQLDLPGFGLLTTGLALFLTGLNLGGGLYTWTNSRVLGTLVAGLVILVGFGTYEWKVTKSGILNHELFRGGKSAGRTFALCIFLIFIEGVLLFSYIVFYPVMSSNLFETDPFLLTARSQPFWVGCLVTTVLWGYWSTRFRTIRSPLFAGFLLFTAGMVGIATIEPSDNFSSLAFAALAGAGFGAPLILIITGVQLSTPHHLIATATAVTTSSRAVAATIFTAIYAAAFSQRIQDKLPAYIAAAAQSAGLPAASLDAFLSAFMANDQRALTQVPGFSPSVAIAALEATKQAFADSLRVIYIIAAPFGIVACVLCLFLGDLKKTMNYHVDAPVEDLHAKSQGAFSESTVKPVVGV
ncbi:hypothetical protein LTS08_007971 [Lithohypha guttulata]|nr:hypothetical protein LTS08_007971 [Lithohypha guttulata]